MLCPRVRRAAVCEVDIAGDLVDVHPVGEAQRRAAGLRGEHGRFPTVRPDAHQPHVCVGDVEVAGVVVEPKAQRPATGSELSVATAGSSDDCASQPFLV